MFPEGDPPVAKPAGAPTIRHNNHLTSRLPIHPRAKVLPARGSASVESPSRQEFRHAGVPARLRASVKFPSPQEFWHAGVVLCEADKKRRPRKAPMNPCRMIYWTLILISFVFASSDLGRTTFRTPSLYDALILSCLTSFGRGMVRTKLP